MAGSNGFRWFLAGSGTFLVMIAMVTAFSDQGAQQSPVPTISYVGLTLEERQVAEAVINDIDPQYLIAIKSIAIVDKVEKDMCPKGCSGYNYKGDIVMGFYSEDKLREGICHELLHSVVKSQKGDGGNWTAPYHLIVFDLAKEQPCFLSTDTTNSLWQRSSYD